MNILNKLSVKTKIIANNAVLIVLLVGATTYALYAMKSIGTELNTIAKEDIPLTSVISNITIHQLSQAVPQDCYREQMPMPVPRATRWA